MRSGFQREVVENIRTHTLCWTTFFFQNRSVFDIMWKNKAQTDMSQMTIYYGACALRAEILRIQTHARYVIRIASPPQQYFRECSFILAYTYIACIVSLLTLRFIFKIKTVCSEAGPEFSQSSSCVTGLTNSVQLKTATRQIKSNCFQKLESFQFSMPKLPEKNF